MKRTIRVGNVEASRLILRTYQCGYTKLCNSCKLRFRCLTQVEEELCIEYDDIKTNSLEWNFALEKYLHGRILNLAETATRYEVFR